MYPYFWNIILNDYCSIKIDRNLYIPLFIYNIDISSQSEICFFLFIYSFISLFLFTFAAVNKLAMTYPTNPAQQRNISFFAFFSALYLVVSDILLTHTHTQALLAFNHSFFLPAYARAKRGVTLVNKGLLGVSFVRFFVSVCELLKRQNKDVLSIDFTTKDTYNSLVIVCFLSLISRAGSGKTLSACREGERTVRRFI